MANIADTIVGSWRPVQCRGRWQSVAGRLSLALDPLVICPVLGLRHKKMLGMAWALEARLECGLLASTKRLINAGLAAVPVLLSSLHARCVSLDLRRKQNLLYAFLRSN